RLLAFNKESVSAAESSQTSLFDGLSGGPAELTLEPYPSLGSKQQLAWEKELLGVYVSGHPLDDYAKELDKPPRIAIGDIRKAVTDREDIAIVRMKGGVVTAGMVESVRELLTKK